MLSYFRAPFPSKDKLDPKRYRKIHKSTESKYIESFHKDEFWAAEMDFSNLRTYIFYHK